MTSDVCPRCDRPKARPWPKPVREGECSGREGRVRGAREEQVMLVYIAILNGLVAVVCLFLTLAWAKNPADNKEFVAPLLFLASGLFAMSTAFAIRLAWGAS